MSFEFDCHEVLYRPGPARRRQAPTLHHMNGHGGAFGLAQSFSIDSWDVLLQPRQLGAGALKLGQALLDRPHGSLDNVPNGNYTPSSVGLATTVLSAAMAGSAGMADLYDALGDSDEYLSEIDEASETVAPADLIASPSRPSIGGDDARSLPELFHCLLEFPSSYYPVQVPAFRVGRDVSLEERLTRRKNKLLCNGRVVQKLSRKRKRSMQDVDGDQDVGDVSEDGGSGSDADEWTSPLWTVGGVSGQKLDQIEGDEDLVYIYTPFNDQTGESDLKSISKEHLRFYLGQRGWNMQVLGRNGVFLNGHYHGQEAEVELADLDVIAIKDLEFRFHLTPLVEDYPGADPGDLESLSDSDEVDGLKTQPPSKGDISKFLDIDAGDPAPSVEGGQALSAADAPAKPVKLKLKLDTSQQKLDEKSKPPKSPSRSKKPELDPENLLKPGEKLPERRGPGRPPANGKMSKREMRLRQKAQKEGKEYDALVAKETREKSTAEGAVEGEDGSKDETVRKKKKPRKRSTTAADEGDVDGSIAAPGAERQDSSTDFGPKEPSPKIEDYTEEQLAKPSGTYQDFLFTVLSEAGHPLALQQIYNAVKARWPHFRFGVESNGWESSVRHNLQGCNSFRKARKEGKGHAWEINPEVPFVSKTTKKPETHFVRPSSQPSTSQYQVRTVGIPPLAGHTPATYASHFRPNATSLVSGSASNIARPPGIPVAPQGSTQYASAYHNATMQQLRPGQSVPSAGPTAGPLAAQPRPIPSPNPPVASQARVGMPPSQMSQHPDPQLSQLLQQRPNNPAQVSQQRAAPLPPSQNLQRATAAVGAGLPPTVGSRPGNPMPAGVSQARPAPQSNSFPQSFANQSINSRRAGVLPATPPLIMDQIRANQVPTLFTDVKNKFVENLAPNERSSKAASFDMAIRWVMENSMKDDFKTRTPAQLDSGTVKVVEILRGLLANTVNHETKQMRRQNAQGSGRAGSSGGAAGGVPTRSSTPVTPLQAQARLAVPPPAAGNRVQHTPPASVKAITAPPSAAVSAMPSPAAPKVPGNRVFSSTSVGQIPRNLQTGATAEAKTSVTTVAQPSIINVTDGSFRNTTARSAPESAEQ